MDFSNDLAFSAHKSRTDPLLDCLYVLAQLSNNRQTKASLIAGLPLVDNLLTPSLFIRAAKRANLSARVVKKQLHEISPLVLPVVLILENNNACVLKSIDDRKASIILSETGTGEIDISLEELQLNYTGYSIYAKPESKFEKRAEHEYANVKGSWFWGTVSKFKSHYIQIAIASFIINVLALATPLFVMNVYDRVVPNNAIETLWVLAVGVIVVFGFDFILKNLKSYIIDATGRKIDAILGAQILHHILDLRSEYKPDSVGGFANRINSYEGIREFFTSTTIGSIFDLPFVFVFLWLVSYVGGSLVFIPMLAMPIVIIVGIFLEIPMRKSVNKDHVGGVEKQAILVESLLSLESIKSLNAEGQLQKKWETNISRQSKAGLHSKFYSNIIINFTMYITQMVTVVTVFFGVYLIKEGEITMGVLIACSMLNARVLMPLSKIATIISQFQRSRLGLQALNDIMDLPTERGDGKSLIHRADIEGDIRFDEVSFNYPEQSQKALTKVNFEIKHGEKVALIGRIGSGKSTLLKLLLGLYQPTEGSIFVDDIDRTQLDPADLRRHIGYVSQDAPLFYGTVKENILVAAPWCSDEELLTAAKLSGVDDFVHRHPQGYDMNVGERGENLSTGQRQAICISRAILTNPNIILFDEPTSAMDSTTENNLIMSMKAFLKEKTLLVVTHKRTMLQLVDRIIIFNNGKVVLDDERDKVLRALAAGELKVSAD